MDERKGINMNKELYKIPYIEHDHGKVQKQEDNDGKYL